MCTVRRAAARRTVHTHTHTDLNRPFTWSLQRLTIPEAVIIQFVLLRMSKVLLETVEDYNQPDLNPTVYMEFIEIDDTRGCNNTICLPEDDKVLLETCRGL